MALWVQYMVIYTILLGLIPSTWISVIWDQIIDPEFDLEKIEQPENKIIKLFYEASGRINTSVVMRNVVFVLIGVMMMLSSMYDLILTPCMLENPRVGITQSFSPNSSTPQNYTYRCALSIMVLFTFIRTLHMFKILLSIVSLLFYFLIIFGLIGHTENELLNTRTFFSVPKLSDISVKLFPS